MKTARSMSKVKPEVTPVSATPAMTKEQEVRFRERATTVKDRVAEMMRAMFSTIDAQRASAADQGRALAAVRKERDAALDVLDVAVPTCSWKGCEDKATRREVDNPNHLCDRHTNERPMFDCKWGEMLRALTAVQSGAAKERPPDQPAVAKE